MISQSRCQNIIIGVGTGVGTFQPHAAIWGPIFQGEDLFFLEFNLRSYIKFLNVWRHVTSRVAPGLASYATGSEWGQK